jgi:hypothetical protein
MFFLLRNISPFIERARKQKTIEYEDLRDFEMRFDHYKPLDNESLVPPLNIILPLETQKIL